MTISEDLIEKLKDLNLPVIIIPISENIISEPIPISENKKRLCILEGSTHICSPLCPNYNPIIPPVINNNILPSEVSKKLTSFVNKCNKDNYKTQSKNKSKKCGWSSDSSDSDHWPGHHDHHWPDHHDHHWPGHHDHHWPGHHDHHGGHNWHAKESSKNPSSKNPSSKNLSSKKLLSFINNYSNKHKHRSRRRRRRRNRDHRWSSGSDSCHKWRSKEPSKKLTHKILSEFINKYKNKKVKGKKSGWFSESSSSDDSLSSDSSDSCYGLNVKQLVSRKKISKSLPSRKKNKKKYCWSSGDSWCSDDSWSSGSHHHWHSSPPKNAIKYKSNKKHTKLKAQFPVFERYIIAFNNLTNDQTKTKINDLTAAPLWHQTITNTEPTPIDNFSTVHCYVMDTGIMANHVEFSSNQVFMAYNAISKSINAQDDNGHGTCVASLIGGSSVGISNKVILHSVKVLDSSGSGYVSDIIAGLNWIMQYKKPNSIINMSFGGNYSKSLDYAIKQCILANIPIVCSSGNSGIDASNLSPANSSSVYTVSAYDSNKTKPSWSNFGPVVTTFAPGDSLKSAWNDSTSSYYLVGGTSFACPIVVGIIARFLKIVPNATLLQITDFLNKSEINNEIINIGSINTPNKRIVFNQTNTVI